MGVSIIRTAWAGTTGGAGITQTAFRDKEGDALSQAQAQTAVNAMRSYWDAIKAYLPNEVTLTVSPVVDDYDIVDGQLESSIAAATAPTAVQGTATGSYAMASGMKVNLNTGVIRNGRRVRGAIYIVPADSAVYNALGSVASGTRTAVNAAGATFLSTLDTGGMHQLVWSRPVPVGAPNGPRVGDVAVVSTHELNEKGAILRGRRD